MSFKSFKKYTILLLFVIGLTACTDMSGDPSNKVARPIKFGKTFHKSAKPMRRGTDLAARALLGGSSNLFSTSFFSMGNGSGNLWDRMRNDFQFSNYENQPAVRAQIQWFLNNQAYLNRTISRAAPYMYYIFEQVQERHLPGELVLLPVIESAYNPFVRSAAGASGLWQLMPGTARGFGVRQNFWFDGRRDIYASTNAALDYLTYLWNFFGGDWLLAVAAYDTGEGNVQNAIRRNAMHDKDTTFWSLPLAAETRSYVPRLLALAAIIRNPSKYGITLPKISDKPYLEQVNLDAPINLNQAAKLAGLSLAELKQLNPGYSRNTTDPTGPHQLTLPVDRIAMFKERLVNIQANLPAKLAQIDAESEETVMDTPQVNEPLRETVSADHKPVVKQAAKTKKNTHTQHYTVRSGDNLGKIANKFGMTIATLKRINHLKGNALKPGQRLIIR